MKNNIIKYLTSVGLMIGLAATAHANSINGTIQMAGAVTLNADLLTASSATFANPAGLVMAATGDYSGVPTLFAGPQVSFFTFNIVAGAQSVSPLWQFAYGGNTYEFDLSNITSVGSSLGANTRSANDLLIKGSGIVSIGGGSFTPTPASWSFAITDTGHGTTFTFGFAQSDTSIPNSIPDGGLTVMLLGGALSGLALIRRKLA